MNAEALPLGVISDAEARRTIDELEAALHQPDSTKPFKPVTITLTPGMAMWVASELREHLAPYEGKEEY